MSQTTQAAWERSRHIIRSAWGRDRVLPFKYIVADCLYGNKQLLRSSRRNESPAERIDGPFLMRHEHVTGTLVERREIAPTSSRANGVLHHPPEAFNRVEVVPAMGG